MSAIFVSFQAAKFRAKTCMAFSPHRKHKPGISLHLAGRLTIRRYVPIVGRRAGLDRGKALRIEVLKRIADIDLVRERALEIGAIPLLDILAWHRELEASRSLEHLHQDQLACKVRQGGWIDIIPKRHACITPLEIFPVAAHASKSRGELARDRIRKGRSFHGSNQSQYSAATSPKKYA
jgi:hypothetical protein